MVDLCFTPNITEYYGPIMNGVIDQEMKTDTTPIP